MNSAKGKAYAPNPDYSREDWDEVSDNPPLTDEEWAGMKPAREVLGPAFFASVAKRRALGARKTPTKKLISLRIDPDVLEKYRSTGSGWQARMNEVLRKGAGL